MATHGCINNKCPPDTPWEELGMVAVTLVCMFLMIYDILVGLCTKTRWLPCKMFRLNSLTLGFVTLAVKLTVDTTTPMPSAWEQLFKLCNTSLLCVYMGYIMPSVGVTKDPTNMSALSGLVLSVFVSMCIQMYNGGVDLFIPEHIIMLCFMLILLVILWACVLDMKVVKRFSGEKMTNLFRSKKTVLERLKICYLYGYSCNPQFVASKNFTCISVDGLNLFCLAILIQAAYRTKSEKFCKGNFFYDWSLPTLVVTQILTVIAGSSVSIFRWFTMAAHVICLSYDDIGGEGEPYQSNPIFIGRKRIRKCLFNAVNLINVVICTITYPVSFLAFCLVNTIENFKSSSNVIEEEFEDLLDDRIGIDEWTLRKGLTEMENEIKFHKRKPNDLFQLLSSVTPSQPLMVKHISDRVDPDGESIPVSVLSVVLLIRIAQVSLPKHLNRPLMKTFWKSYKFLYFIEKNLFLTSPEFAKTLEVANAVKLATKCRHLPVKTFDRRTTGQGQSRSDTDCALEIIAEVKNKMPEDMIYSELTIIENYIHRRQYSSIEELRGYIEQLYVDMLHVILAQFPIAIFKALTEIPGSDYHERVRFALKLVCKIELLEARIQWKFPQGCNLLGLITAPVLATEEDGNVVVNNYDVPHATEGTIEVHETEETATVAIHDDNDVIIEVEDSNLRKVC